MALEMNWVSRDQAERIALVRQNCYGHRRDQQQKFVDSVVHDHRQHDGDFLIARDGNQDVGTATSLSLRLNLRGASLPCQGVAWVGTAKTHRRASSPSQTTAPSSGVATQVMHATLAKARERGQFVSALMPFRGSFYEHFGYGNAERRTEWTLPTAILPKGEFSGIRFVEPAGDLPQLLDLRSREFTKQHGDIASDAASMNYWISQVWTSGMAVVDHEASRFASYCFFSEERNDKIATLVSDDWSCESPEAFKRLLYWMASLKDQYSFVRITTPGDWPINHLLRESQLPHRQVDHPHASARPFTRMQIRVLDHVRVLEQMRLHSTLAGEVVVYIKECEGTISKLLLHFGDGLVNAKPTTQEPDVVLTDACWASVVAGQFVAREAIAWGLLETAVPDKARLLNAFGAGPLPWCQEYF